MFYYWCAFGPVCGSACGRALLFGICWRLTAECPLHYLRTPNRLEASLAPNANRGGVICVAPDCGGGAARPPADGKTPALRDRWALLLFCEPFPPFPSG